MMDPVAPVGFQMKKEIDTLAVGVDAFPAYVYKFNYDFKWNSGLKDKVEQYLNDTKELIKKYNLTDPEADGGISSVHWNYSHQIENFVNDYNDYDGHPFGLPKDWPELEEFYGYLQHILALVCDEWGYDPNWDRKISESWMNVHPKGGWTTEHHHQNVMFATTAYMNKPNNSGNFLVRNPLEVFKKSEPTDTSYWRDEKFWAPIEVETNDVLIFPGWLTHKTEVNESDEERYILSTNYVPIKSIDVGNNGTSEVITYDAL